MCGALQASLILALKVTALGQSSNRRVLVQLSYLPAQLSSFGRSQSTNHLTCKFNLLLILLLVLVRLVQLSLRFRSKPMKKENLALCIISLVVALFSSGVTLGQETTGASAFTEYEKFKLAYNKSGNSASLRIALSHVQKAELLKSGEFKFAYGIGAVHLRLEEYRECIKWFTIAENRATGHTDRDNAKSFREYCQVQIYKENVNRRISSIRITFSLKAHSFHRELDLSEHSSAAIPAAEAYFRQHENRCRRTPNFPRVFRYQHEYRWRSNCFISGSSDSWSDDALESKSHARRITEYETMIRRRFFADGRYRNSLTYILGGSPFDLSNIASRLYPDVSIPSGLHFGFYHKRDRLIIASARGGYGTVLHELMHALIHTDFPQAPLWLEEGMAMLYERSGWSSERLVPAPNWRMDHISPDDALEPNALHNIDRSTDLDRKHLALLKLLFVYLDNEDRLSQLYTAVRNAHGDLSLVFALDQIDFRELSWRIFVEQSFAEYALETLTVNSGGLSNPTDIKFVQQALNSAMSTTFKIDGLWGPNTEGTLKAFQRRFGLEADGIVGPNTIEALRREFTTATLRD